MRVKKMPAVRGDLGGCSEQQARQNAFYHTRRGACRAAGKVMQND